MTEKENTNNKLFYFNKNNINTCYYSKGDKHSTCTHPHYCIFNKHVIQLEKQLTNLNNNLEKYNNILKNLKKNDIFTNETEESCKKKIKNIENDLIKLNKFKENILGKKEGLYGYQQ